MSGLTMRHFLAVVATHDISAREQLYAEGFHPNVVYAKAVKAARKGYVEAGVIDDRCWLTPKGEATLAQWIDTRPGGLSH